jgi:WhiB family redox-sensing transcriptional regulator
MTRSETGVTSQDPQQDVACKGLGELFFSPEEDGRDEAGRRERETACKAVCATCDYVIPCAWQALVYNEQFGVWGGMSEHERRQFRKHLRAEGYIDEVPHGAELAASLRSFWRKRQAG